LAVKLSVKSDYAARAVLGLARHYPVTDALRVEDLATQQAIPANYLVQILIELKAQGIARSLRGKEGVTFAGTRAVRNYARGRAAGSARQRVRHSPP
jgi:DNA-binding IscR family transcriptional regulator